GPAPPAPARGGGLTRKKAAATVEAPVGIEIPEGSPEHFHHLLTRVNNGLKAQDPQETCLSLRDSLEYLVRYFAGVAALAVRALGEVPEQVAEEWAHEPLPVSRCERLLHFSLAELSGQEDPLAKEITQVFRPLQGGDAHTKLIALDVDNKLRALGKFCTQSQSHWDKVRCIRENSRFMPVLKDWVAASRAYFKAVTTHAEPPSEDGRVDVVVEHGSHFLELLAPEYTFLIRQCPFCLPLYRGNDPPVPEEEEAVPEPVVQEPVPPRAGVVAPQPEPEQPVPSSPRRLDDAMADLLKGVKPSPAPAPPPATVPAQAKDKEAAVATAPPPQEKQEEEQRARRQEAEEEEPAMAHDVSFVGSGRTPDGRLIHGGYINVVNVGGGMLSATVRATHPCVVVKPVRFKGKYQRIEYQIDEADMPTSKRVFVVIRSANEERQIPLWQMLPTTSTLAVPDLTLKTLLLGPSLLYFLFMLIVHSVVVRNVYAVFKRVLGGNPSMQQMMKAELAPSQVASISNPAQFDGMVLIGFTLLVPMLISWVFSLAPPDQKHRTKKFFLIGLLLPLILVTLVTPFYPVVAYRPELKPMNLKAMYLWFLFLNGLSCGYLYVLTVGELEEWVRDVWARRFIGVVVFVVFMLLAMQAVFLQ
ncbi:MAG: hypothetical protein AB1758_20200, partial [Candidatus Eremiobacterota bacterium]